MISKQTKDFMGSINDETLSIQLLSDLISNSIDIKEVKPGSDFDIDKWLKLMEEQPIEVKTKTSLEESLEVVFNTLREDKDYYKSWSDNIAMSFKDIIKMNMMNDKGVRGTWLDDVDLNISANKAANNFLNQLIKKTVKEKYLISQEQENKVYDLLALNIQLSLAITDNFKLDSEDTLILNVNPDYSSIISQKLSHQFSSSEGSVMDVLSIDVPNSDKTDISLYYEQLELLLNIIADEGYKNFIFVNTSVVSGNNYKWIKDIFTKYYNSKNLLFCTLFESIGSKFKSDCVGEYYDDTKQDLTFYWEKFNKHFK